MSIKTQLEKGIWRSDVYYQMAKTGSQDYNHPGMVLLKSVAQKCDKILDFGCGEGTRLNWIAKNKKSSLGLDISQKGIELAKKKFPKLNFKKADLEKVQLKSNIFDLVYSAYVLEHLQNPEKVLKEAMRLLKPYGYLLLIAPNYGAPNRCSPPFRGSRQEKLIGGFLKDFMFLPVILSEAKDLINKKILHYIQNDKSGKFSTSSNNKLPWKKVTPISTKDYDVDWDTTIEPYIGSLVRFLKSHKLKIVQANSCWSQELPNAKPHQKLFRFLGEKNIYPFKYWGPHLVVLAQK
jgi:ubiquinone/menaquinone biosynthesis C-methylase UbiE